jgi:sulfite exporter TauE/SafE
MYLLNGLLLGLSTGLFCLAYCLPVFGPLLLAEKRTLKDSFFLLLKFSLGRLLAYCLFGVLVGYLGLKIESQFIHNLAWLILIVLGLLMIFYALGLIKAQIHLCRFFQKIKIPWLVGFLVGLNICPSFLIALPYVFNLKGVLAGLLFFLMFFLGTTLYLIPATFFGFFSKYRFWRQIARVSAFLVGMIFIGYGVAELLGA